MMRQYLCRCGTLVSYRLRHRARKNIILRSIDGVLDINVPPFVGERQWQQWLAENEALLLRWWRQVQHRSTVPVLPAEVWYGGVRWPWVADAASTEWQWHAGQGFRLPEAWMTQPQQVRAALAAWLYRAAEAELLPQLQQHSHRLQLWPAAVGLSRARGFWGVCRRSGIRLNWRLIGAPPWVRDYVCVHELCHLPHPNHSRDFWALVHRHTPDADAAKHWLRRYGYELFALG